MIIIPLETVVREIIETPSGKWGCSFVNLCTITNLTLQQYISVSL